MKRLIVIFLVVIFLTGCVAGQNDREAETDHQNERDELSPSKKQLQEPPELIVLANDQEVLAVLGTYSWHYDNGDGTGTGVEAESGPPSKLATAQEDTLKTKLDSEISLVFDHDPLSIEVYVWNSSARSREITVEDQTFLTDQTGDVVYEIYAKWNQGTAHYAVEIIVE